MSGLTNPSPATNLKFDASNNVLANIAAQNINPNVNTAASVTGSVGYVNQLAVLSGLSGLSATVSAANAPVNIGSAIAISNNGIEGNAVTPTVPIALAPVGNASMMLAPIFLIHQLLFHIRFQVFLNNPSRLQYLILSQLRNQS